MLVLVISDSHGSSANMDKVLKLEPHDLAVHLGDHMMSAEYMERNFDYWVAGNNDYFGPEHVSFTCAGVRFYVLHGHTFFSFTYQRWLEKMAKHAAANDAHVVLFGHSHFPEHHSFGKVQVANPGSISLPRPSHALSAELKTRLLLPSYLILRIESEKVSFIFRDLPES